MIYLQFASLASFVSFSEFNSHLNNNINKANDYLMKNFHNSFNECASEVTLNKNESESTLTNEYEHLSPDNSMNQVSSWMMIRLYRINFKKKAFRTSIIVSRYFRIVLYSLTVSNFQRLLKI